MSIAGGRGSPLGDTPVFIAMIQATGVAAKTQRLKVAPSSVSMTTGVTSQPCVCQVGDRIVSINGVSVDGVSHSDVVSMLKNSYGSISLQVSSQTRLSAAQCT